MKHTIKKLGICLALAMTLTGCASGPPRPTDITLQFKAESPINSGILLPIDVMTVDQNKASAILSISPDEWFGNPMREQLTPDEIHKLAIRAGGERVIQVKVNPQSGKIILYADYEGTSQRDLQRLVIDAEKGSLEDTYLINVKLNQLELTP